MLIKLTNAADEHRGNNIYISHDWIVAVFNAPTQPGGSLRTIVYGGPQGTSWTVDESPEEIYRLINTLSE
jgi:hypothetical protein